MSLNRAKADVDENVPATRRSGPRRGPPSGLRNVQLGPLKRLVNARLAGRFFVVGAAPAGPRPELHHPDSPLSPQEPRITMRRA